MKARTASGLRLSEGARPLYQSLLALFSVRSTICTSPSPISRMRAPSILARQRVTTPASSISASAAAISSVSARAVKASGFMADTLPPALPLGHLSSS